MKKQRSPAQLPILNHIRRSATCRQYVDDEDIRVLLSRMPKELWTRLTKVIFRDHWGRDGCLGYVLTHGRREIVLCNLPWHLSLRRLCIRDGRSPEFFGAPERGQWPPLAIRRIHLYGTFLHELGHIQVVDPKNQSSRRKYADETKAEEFAQEWIGTLWAEPFDHPDPVHNPPTANELALIRDGSWEESHALYKRTLKEIKGERKQNTASPERQSAWRKSLQLAVARFPQHSLAWQELGRQFWINGEYESAIECFNQVRAVDPHLPMASFFGALCYTYLDRKTEARAWFERAVRLDQYPPQCRTFFAEKLGQWGEKAEAGNLFRAILKSKPDYHPAILRYGQFLVNEFEGREQEAIVYLRKAVDKEPDDYGSLYELGCALWYVDETAEALPFLTRAIEAAPDRGEVYNIRAQAFEELGMEDEAQVDRDMAAKLEGDSPKGNSKVKL